MPDTTKSGIQSPAGYNGKDPKGGLAAPVKHYPGSGDIGKGRTGKSSMVEGPLDAPTQKPSK